MKTINKHIKIGALLNLPERSIKSWKITQIIDAPDSHYYHNEIKKETQESILFIISPISSDISIAEAHIQSILIDSFNLQYEFHEFLSTIGTAETFIWVIQELFKIDSWDTWLDLHTETVKQDGIDRLKILEEENQDKKYRLTERIL